jgi:hypothetical protein
MRDIDPYELAHETFVFAQLARGTTPPVTRRTRRLDTRRLLALVTLCVPRRRSGRSDVSSDPQHEHHGSRKYSKKNPYAADYTEHIAVCCCR